MNSTRCILTILFVALLPVAGNAQTSRSGGGANVQQLQQLQQLASERTQLQAENAKQKKELEELKKQVKGLTTDKAALSQRAQSSAAAVARAAEGKESLEQSLQQQRARMEELVGKFRETATALRTVESDRADVTNRLDASQRELKTCVDKNLALYKVNVEALDQLENQGLWSSLARKEPFTQLKRVEIENLIDGYRDRATEQRMPDAAAAPKTTAEGTARSGG